MTKPSLPYVIGRIIAGVDELSEEQRRNLVAWQEARLSDDMQQMDGRWLQAMNLNGQVSRVLSLVRAGDLRGAERELIEIDEHRKAKRLK